MTQILNDIPLRKSLMKKFQKYITGIYVKAYRLLIDIIFITSIHAWDQDFCDKSIIATNIAVIVNK